MIWRMLNKLFGYDYILWTNLADSGIARVIVFPDGTLGYWRYRGTSVFDKIHKKEQVVWLTCKATKYIKDNK